MCYRERYERYGKGEGGERGDDNSHPASRRTLVGLTATMWLNVVLPICRSEEASWCPPCVVRKASETESFLGSITSHVRGHNLSTTTPLCVWKGARAPGGAARAHCFRLCLQDLVSSECSTPRFTPHHTSDGAELRDLGTGGRSYDT